MAAPLYEALLRYQERSPVRFHMPGHAGIPEAVSAFNNLLELDVTELPDTGSLYDGAGPVCQAEEAAAGCFGTKASFFSAGGSTLAIQTMLTLACAGGKKVLMDRCIHRSALHAVMLLGLEPVWIWRLGDAGPCLPGRISPRDVAEALDGHPDAAAVYLTSPDYYGVLCDIPAIAQIVHSRGIPLLVDSAHGGHLGHLEEPLAPWKLGADLTACSAHKTMPALTGAAWLHVQNETYLPSVRQAMALFGSTSPSFPILLSLDLCAEWLQKEGKERFSVLENRVKTLKQGMAKQGYRFPLGLVDPLRLAVFTGAYGISGTQAAGKLREQGIEPEYGDDAYLILIPSAFHTEEDFMKLNLAMASMPKPGWNARDYLLPAPPRIACPPGDVLGMRQETIPVAQAQGRISAELHTPCPPAVPLIMPGERVDKAAKELLISYEISNIKVVK